MIARLRDTLRQFGSAQGGNTVVTFALAFIPLVGLTGAAVDYSRANSLQTSMQAAADTTALMVAQDAASQTSTALQTSASTYYRALFTRTEVSNVAVTATYSNTNGSTVVIRATATYPTSFMGVVGFRQLPLAAVSTASFGNSRLRVALVLDNTGSMADAGKITALKTAAKNLIAQLRAAAVNNGDVYVSIIPFSKDVNVGGPTNYNANWINWKLWDAANGGSSSSSSGSICYNGQIWTWNGSSLTNGGTCTTTTSTICYNGTQYTWNGSTFTAGGSCSTSTSTSTSSTVHSTWNGCITDRDQDYDIRNTTPNPSDVNLAAGIASTLFPAEQYASCPVEMMGLSYNWTQLNAKIDAMVPNGNTNQGIGLAWGWQSLTQNAPLNAPAEDSNYTYQHIIILLTDGLNTQNRWTTDPSQIDARQATMCTNVKNAGITLYTIQVNTGGDATSTLLRNCASDLTKWYVLTSASQIVTAFNQIGTNLSKLRIAK
jgi:Flp pilus assembly protein TadG